jgi:hypothetical protein
MNLMSWSMRPVLLVHWDSVSFSQRINSYTSGISLTDWHTMNRIEMAT